MYKTTHQNRQNRVDRITMAEGIKPVTITLQEEYETVRRLASKINEEIEGMPKGPERDTKIRRQISLNTRCADLKKQLGFMRHKNLSECIATQAKLICPPALWECIMNAAKTEWEEVEARMNQPGTPVEDE